MTLLDAKEVNPEESHKKNRRITLAVSLLTTLLVVGLLGFLLGDGWFFWYWPDEHVVGTFFATLQKRDYKTAYSIWLHDPEWEKHPDRKPIHDYPYNDFYRDWGPGGEWGLIRTYKVFGASTCPNQGGGSSSGVLIDVVVNDRSQHAQVWREKSDHTLGYPPCELIFR